MKPKLQSESYTRKAIYSSLKDWCVFSKEHDYIEVTEWANGEGYDIDVYGTDKYEKFQLTYGEFRLLKKLIKELENPKSAI